MTAKEKLIGIIIVVIGALPFLLKIEAIGTAFAKYTWLLPGELIYQLIIIILGIILIFRRGYSMGY